MSKLILYDIPSRDPSKCWSCNVWKARLTLNYKGIEYETEWIEYPDIAPTLQGFGIAPNENPGDTPYTLPAVLFPDGRYVMTSEKIVQELEARYPSPSLNLKPEILPLVRPHIGEFVQSLSPAWLPKIPGNILRPRSVEYFNKTRSESLGQPLADFEKPIGEVIDQVRKGLLPIVQILKESDGPFFVGKQVTFVDFVIGGLIKMFKDADEGIFEEIVATDPVLKDFFEALGPWLKKDD